jgi:hypothetical protein
VIDKERPVAWFTPSIRKIKLYADGRIDYQGKSGSVVGATARVERSGEKRGLRDTRKVVLRIEGPSVVIAASLPANAFRLHRAAEEFAAEVNEVSNDVDGWASAPGVQSAPDPPETIDQSRPLDTPVSGAAIGSDATLESMDALIARLERLGNLRNSGVLTEDEFQEQKARLLRPTHGP